MPDTTVQSVLKVSYDKLDSREQGVFLDIACFFRGEDKNFVSRILGSDAEVGIKVLEDRCLITISENILDMHDLLQQMGREVVRQEGLKESRKYPQEPGKRSRLWDPKDVESVLIGNTVRAKCNLFKKLYIYIIWLIFVHLVLGLLLAFIFCRGLKQLKDYL